MHKIKGFARRSSLVLAALGLFGAWVLGDIALFADKVSAAQITNRSLAISDSANGTLTAGQNVTYTFTFTIPGDTTPVQSIDFEFCETPLPGLDCNLPSGQSVTGATLGTVGGDASVDTGWALGTSGNAPTDSWSNGTSGTGGRVRIERTDATNVSSDAQIVVPLDGITNPDADNQSFFVRMVVYANDDYTAERDAGSVVSSTAQQIDVTARVQETLNFSVGAPDTSGDPSLVPAPTSACDPLTDDGAMQLGDTDGVLSFNTAYDAYSFFRVSTNANNGTVIQYSGETLQFSGNDIDAVGGTAAQSDVGEEQFGLAIDTTVVESDANTLNFLDTIPADYDTGGGTITNGGTAEFAFDPTSATTPVDLISTGAGTGTETEDTIICDTASVRYIGNVSTTTPPGIYTTSISYIAVPEY